MSRLPCTNCNGGGCTECVFEVMESAGGDQGLSAAELEVFQLRDEVQRLKKDLMSAQVAAAEAQRATAEMKRERDDALNSLAMFTGEARA